MIKNMTEIKKKPGRPLGSKTELPLPDKIKSVFNQLYKSFETDLKSSTPASRIQAMSVLAGQIINHQTKF